MDTLDPINIKMFQAFETIFAGQGDPIVAAQTWFFRVLREQRKPQKPTVFATTLLTKAMALAPDNVLNLCHDMAMATHLTPKEVKQITKQVLEVIKIRNNLALMLHETGVSDPRQFELFDQHTLQPDDF